MNTMSKCSRYIYCNAPKCPLDKDRALRVKLKEDIDCRLSKEKLTEILKNEKNG